MSSALNVTTAAFGGLREVTTSPLWQWDYGQILQITGLDLPQAFEVHFSNSRKSGETITQIGTDGAVTIPDMYLTSGADIYCFIFLHDGLTDGETEYVIKIPVRERPEPSDIEPTPEQQDAITEAIAALNDAVEQTGEDKEATAAFAEAAAASSLIATEAAQSAQRSATAASGSASTASTAAATATTKASEAAQSASEAESARASARNYAASASDSAGDADEAKTAAQSAAQTATAKASEASTSATNASGSATAASASASLASESATSAAASATTASESATSAATSASTASTKASEASASAIAAQTAQAAAETAQGAAEEARDETVTEAASIRGLLKDKADIIISNAEGAIATFEDGGNNMSMVSCVAKIEPVQDLRGYDHPWPAGGGKNVLNTKLYTGMPYNPTVGSKITFAESPIQFATNDNKVFTFSTTSTWTSLTMIAPIDPAQTYGILATISSTGTLGVSRVYLDANMNVLFVSNSTTTPQSYEGGAISPPAGAAYYCILISNRSTAVTTITVNSPMLALTSSDSTTYAPYSNICPISGWTGAQVVRTGVNVWDEEWESGRYSSGNKTKDANMIRCKNYIPVKPNTTCYFNKGVNNENMWAFFYDKNLNCLNPTANGTNVGDKIATTPDNCHYMRFFLSAQTEYQHDVSINYPSTETEYHAYTGHVYPISWQSEAGTVYGGTIDLISGVLTVTAIGKVFDGTEGWASYQTSPNRFYRYTLTNIQTSSPTNENRACSHFRNATVITSTTSVGFNGYTSSGMNSIWFNFRPDLEEIPDVDAWKAWLAEQYANGTPVQAYCPIITPITYQLTPTEVRTLLGLNNVWADTGDVEVQYRADTKLYIDGKNTDFSKLIAPTEAAYTATRAYTTGSLLIVGSQLYKATASIANGATLTVGTNITATTLAEVIAAL